MGQAEQFRHAVGVEEVVDVYLSSHPSEITTGIGPVRGNR
jgi:hypothetical protein